jgi:hypothetical protein
MRVRRQSQFVGHKAWSQAPLRLNRRVNVLPQPGTGHRKFASFRRRLALAACVAEVVTCCRSTWKMGGRRHTAPGVAGEVVGLETVLTAERGGGEEEGIVWEWL